MNFRSLRAGRAAAGALLLGLSSLAAAWPDKPVTLVVPFPPGGNVDVVARIVAADLQAALPGSTFIIENRAGAGGMLATESVKKATADGYTFLMGVKGAMMYTPLVTKRRVYDWRTDFALVAPISSTPQLLLVNPNVLPVKDLAAFVQAARSAPGKLNTGSPGIGTTNHMASENFQAVTGLEWVTVHYRGNAPATTDLVSGVVSFNFDQLASTTGFIKQGRLRPLAVTSEQRLKSLPDVPTFVESGYKDMVVTTDIAVFGPAGTPEAVVRTLGAALAKIVAQPSFAERLEPVGNTPILLDAASYRRSLESEYLRWSKLIQDRNITAE